MSMRMGVHDERNGADIAVLPLPFGRVGVTRLALTEFRNYRAARLDLAAGPVVLTGPNGAGKTNLLEAVSVLWPGRGLSRDAARSRSEPAATPPAANAVSCGSTARARVVKRRSAR